MPVEFIGKPIEVELGDEVIVGSGAVVLEGMKVPPRKIVVGVPAKIAGDVTNKLASLRDRATKMHQGLPPRCHASLKRIG